VLASAPLQISLASLTEISSYATANNNLNFEVLCEEPKPMITVRGI